MSSGAPLFVSQYVCLCVCFCVDVKPIANDIPLRDISLHVHLYAPHTREYYIIFARDRIHKSVLHPASSLDHYSCVRVRRFSTPILRACFFYF